MVGTLMGGGAPEDNIISDGEIMQGVVGDGIGGAGHSGPAGKWYGFVDVVDMRHMRRHFESLEEVEVGASMRVERLEIR